MHCPVHGWHALTGAWHALPLPLRLCSALELLGTLLYVAVAFRLFDIVGPMMNVLSRLHHAACGLAVYVLSCAGHPITTQDSLPACRLGFSWAGLAPAGLRTQISRWSSAPPCPSSQILPGKPKNSQCRSNNRHHSQMGVNAQSVKSNWAKQKSSYLCPWM
jgi:hypothetical protein